VNPPPWLTRVTNLKLTKGNRHTYKGQRTHTVHAEAWNVIPLGLVELNEMENK
jgi:hypothetical protein